MYGQTILRILNMNESNIRKLLIDGERVTLECKKVQDSVLNSLGGGKYSAFTNIIWRNDFSGRS